MGKCPHETALGDRKYCEWRDEYFEIGGLDCLRCRLSAGKIVTAEDFINAPGDMRRAMVEAMEAAR